MEETEECAPVTVEGSWTPAQVKTLKNKLQLYFQSKKKSGGGECRVEVEDGAQRAHVFFSSAEVRERVLARQNHEIVLDSQTVKLRLSSEASPKNVTEVPEPPQSVSVVLDNIGDMPKDLLPMLLKNISGLDDSHYSLEIIYESNRAVVTFSNPTDGERFLSVAQSSQKLQKHKLSARQLEAATSVRVENLPPTVIDDMLELYFEDNWTQPENIVMIPNEEAAIVTFKDPKVVTSICIKEDYSIVSTPVKVYPYFESLSSALYGKKRPTWKMPKPFTETVSHIIWTYLQEKKLIKSINDHMHQYFCTINMDSHQAELTPLPNFLRQKGLTAKQVDAWESSVQDAFRQHMSQYTEFECPATEPAWKAAEAEVRSVIGNIALLVFDGSRGVLTVAGGADDIKRIRAPVENIIQKAVSQIERQTNSVPHFVDLSPAMYFILQQVGLQKAAQDISQEMTLAYDKNSQKLTITGLNTEVSKTEIWILEQKKAMSQKQINVPPGILDFLKSVDPMDMSNHLFTSQGISSIFSVESTGILLTGSSDRALADAEGKMKEVLTVMDVDVEDQGVLNLLSWNDLKQQLLDSCNSKMKTVSIQDYPGREDKITVAGFLESVKEVSRNLTEFFGNYSRTQESIHVKSVVLHFLEKKKSLEWSSISKDNDVKVNLDPMKQRIFIEGARLHVQKAKSSLNDLTSSLFYDQLSVNKPGAKKFFQSQQLWFQSVVMTELDCMVMLRPENQEEEEEENLEENNVVSYCKVRTAAGVQVSVSKADICHYGVDAVVNAANEDLQHIGGLALAMLKAAGPQLQQISDNYVSKNGKLCPGEAIVTDSCKLQCKYIVHAVGPRFSDTDRKTAVSSLKLAVTESLKQAERKKCTSIALPAISSGVFGFPVDLCAETIAQAVREYCDSPESVRSLKEIHLVDSTDNTVRVLAAAINKEFSDLGPTMMVPSQAEGQSPKPSGGVKIDLLKGNIQDQTTHVIVNTIAANMNLNQGAVSKAILKAAGPSLQTAIQSEAGVAVLGYGDVITTDSFNLRCKKVFHVVCPRWDNGSGQAEETLVSIIRYCLEEAEKLRMGSLSFPAIGTGNLNFPRDMVSRVLLREIKMFSSRSSPQHLREVVIVVHPSDSQTVDCFTSAFSGQTGRNIFEDDKDKSSESQGGLVSQSQQFSASLSQVSSPSTGVYRMKMGSLTLEVSSGDITKETCDAIVNSSNDKFNLQSGVSKAILDSAGPQVQLECAQIVRDPNYKPGLMILTSAGQLPSRNIIHVTRQNDPKHIKDTVYSVLGVCEERGFSSVTLPALGTGQGGADMSLVADAMVEAVVDFVRKKRPKLVHSVKFLIFQTFMVTEFHKSMKKKEGEGVAEKKNLLAKIKDAVSDAAAEALTWISSGFGEQRRIPTNLVLETEEFEPTEFELCADNERAVSLAKKKIEELILKEQTKKVIKEQYISQLSQEDIDEMKDLQRNLTVSITLDRGQQGQEPTICLEGVTRDVLDAEVSIRAIFQKVERQVSLKNTAMVMSTVVQWEFHHPDGKMEAFDLLTNLKLEEAFKSQQTVQIQINNEPYYADTWSKKAVSLKGRKLVELLRTDLKEDNSSPLPKYWDDMNGDLLKVIPLNPGDQEYCDVETLLTQTGLSITIIKIERVQNPTLWKSYQLKKQELDKKNNHKNNEKRLFHGTTVDSINPINRHGFNRSYAGKNAARFGNGAYFAVDPCYSAKRYAAPDTSGHKHMYLARVLVGEFTMGAKGMKAPPAKTSTSDLYDSVTDNTANPTMFIVFNDNHAYPEYLITFT